MPVMVDMQIAIGSSGAPTLSSAPGVQSISRLAAGIYRIQLKDNYASLLGMDANIIEPVTGGAIDPNGGVVGSLYQISTVGDTDWVTAGVPASITPAIGVTLALAAAPSSGTGRVKLISASNIKSIELAGQMMNSNSPAGTNGALILFRCVGQTITMGAYTPAGTNSAPALTMNSYTPAGSVAAGIIAVAAGTAGDAVTNNAGVLNSVGGEDLSVNAQAFTGTPATLTGTVAAPIFTGSAASLTGVLTLAAADPTSGSVLEIRLFLNNSSVM